MAKIDKFRKTRTRKLGRMIGVHGKKAVKSKRPIRPLCRRPPHTPPEEETDKDKQQEVKTH